MRAAFFANDGRLRSGWRFLISAAAFLGVMFAADAAARMARPGSDAGFEAVNRTLAAVLLWALWVWFAAVLDREKRPAAAFGLGLDRAWGKEFVAGIAAGAAMVALCVGGIAVFGSYRGEAAGGSPGQAVAWLWVLFWAALLEELAFRGYPFQRLVEGMGPRGAILILSALFGAVHLGNPNASTLGAVNTILIGVLFAGAYLRTGSLWLVWGIHLGWNAALGLGFGLPVSGLSQFAVVVKGTATGPAWLTGGEYGIEGSLTATVVISAAIALAPKMMGKKAEGSATPAGAGASNG
jgi:membrane protease YdiL (CAAX protease family)